MALLWFASGDVAYVLSLKGPGEWVKCQMTEGKQIRFLSSKRLTKNILQTIDFLSGKTVDYIIKTTICKHPEGNSIIAINQHGFIKNKSSQTSVASFFDWVTSLIGCENIILTKHLAKYSMAFWLASERRLTEWHDNYVNT